MSPRYVMNRLSAVAAHPEMSCISPLAAIDSLWQGLGENVSLDQEYQAKFVGFVEDSVKEYGEMAIRDVQRASEEEFEKAASMLLGSYLNTVAAYCKRIEGQKEEVRKPRDSSERDMREIERSIGVAERGKTEFRQEINRLYDAWKKKGWTFNYKSDSRLRAAVEAKLFPARRELERALTQPRFARQAGRVGQKAKRHRRPAHGDLRLLRHMCRRHDQLRDAGAKEPPDAQDAEERRRRVAMAPTPHGHQPRRGRP